MAAACFSIYALLCVCMVMHAFIKDIMDKFYYAS